MPIPRRKFQFLGVRRLVLAHISSRYSRDAPELLAETAPVFPGAIIARDGMTVEVPFRTGGRADGGRTG